MSHLIINGDNLELLKKYPDNHFDAIVTDPPYGLGKEPDAVEVMTAWATTGYHEIEGKGFMGKEWDAFVPQPVFWKEVFRVLKHGGHVVAFYGTRTYDWGVMAMRFAGFEVRDCIQWLYGSGFPKSYNVAKGIEGKIVNGSSSWNDWKKLDGEKEEVNWGYSKSQAKQGYRDDYTEANKERVGKVNFQSEEAKKWDGWGSALKPANEPIVLARKPLEKGLSIAENVLKWGTGGINIDGCRVGSDNRTYKGMSVNKPEGAGTFRDDNWKPKDIEVNVNGRFPANIILTHHPECECKGVKKVKAIKGGSGEATMKSGNGKNGIYGKYSHNKLGENAGGLGDENGQETVEDWNCHPDCPIKILDEQSGNVGGDTRESKPTYDKSIWGNAKSIESKSLYNDKGGASRFFYVAKASKSERNKGLDGFEEKKGSTNHNSSGRDIGRKQFCQICDKRQGACKCEQPNFSNENPNKRANFHPTVKPVKLMQYLVRLVTPPNGIVLDPFCGSGTTGVACKLEGFQFVGMEQDPEYAKIAEARIKNYKEEKESPIKDKIETINSKFTQQTLF